jgi:hypothetical protein
VGVDDNTAIQEGDIIPTKGTLLSFKTDGVRKIDLVADNLNFTNAFVYTTKDGKSQITIEISNILMALAKNAREGNTDFDFSNIKATYIINSDTNLTTKEKKLITTFNNIAIDFATAKSNINSAKEDIIESIRNIIIKANDIYEDDTKWENSTIYKKLQEVTLSVTSEVLEKDVKSALISNL